MDIGNIFACSLCITSQYTLWYDEFLWGNSDQMTGRGKRDGDNMCVCDDPIDYGNAMIVGWSNAINSRTPIIPLPHPNPPNFGSHFSNRFHQ